MAKHRTPRRLCLAGSAGLGALLMAASAVAQTEPQTAAVGAPTTTATAATDELIVTAEKRAVNIQDVPASVSAVQGDKLEVLGLKSLQDYTRYVPGLVVNSGGSPGQTSVTLRGIAAVGPGSLVGYYLDDTPLGSSNNYARATTFALDLLPYDLDRLEVLRGPQGTLYGAGSMGGLLKYVLRQADPNKFDAKVGAETSYIDHSDGLGYAVRGAVNIPVIKDKLAIRLSAFDQKDQGYVDNVRLGLADDNGVHQYGGRVAVTFKPIDNLRINLNALWYRLKSDDNNAVRLTNDITSTTDPNGADIFSALPGADPYGSSYGFRQPFTKNIDYYSGTVNYDLGPVTLVSATSYSKTKTRQTQDATDLYGPLAVYGNVPDAGVANFKLGLDLKKFTQEVRLVSPTGGRIEWMVGGFYTYEKSTNTQLVTVLDKNYQPLPDPNGFFDPFAAVRLPTTYKEYAAFGDLTFKITDKWDITGGLRYSHNDQAFHQFSEGLLVFGPGITDQIGASSESVATWQVNTKYHLTDQVMAYARVATGYRPGGPNVVLPNVPPTVKSDRLTSYEGGFKTTWMDGRLLLNATAFDIQWKDIQETGFDAVHGVSYLTNAGDAYSRGGELEGFFIPTDGLRFGFNAAYTKAKVTRYLPDALHYYLGERLPGVPEWTGGTTVDYTWKAYNEWSASIGAGWTYRSGSLNVQPIIPFENGDPTKPNPGYTQPTRSPAYNLFDAHAGISNDRWAVNVYVKNITDHRAYLQASPVTGAGTAYDAFLLQPRTVGISVDASF